MICEDDDNTVADPLRLIFLGGAVVYLAAGISLTVALLHRVWFTHDPIDMQSFGVAIAAWAAGLGSLLTGAGAAIWMKSKGDAVAPSK